MLFNMEDVCVICDKALLMIPGIEREEALAPTEAVNAPLPQVADNESIFSMSGLGGRKILTSDQGVSYRVCKILTCWSLV